MADILSLGITGLNAFQSLLSTTSHNIANSNTEGFSRQTTQLITGKPQFVGGTLIGSGVQVGATVRVVDDVLAGVHRTNLSGENHYSAKSEFADQVDSLLSNPNIGVSDAINRFFNSLQELSTETPSTQHRQVLISEAEGLVKRVNTLDLRLNDQYNDINIQIQQSVNRINSLGTSIIKVNKDILTSANLGLFSSPNDLLDERDRLINELSTIVDVSTIEQADGSMDVFIGQGQSLVVGGVQTTFSTARDPNDPAKYDILILGGDSTQSVTSSITGGQIGGLTEFRDEMLEPSRAKLGRIVMSLGMTFNSQHELGIDRNGDMGGKFFNDFNTISLQLSRSIPNENNTGTAALAVTIDEIPRPTAGPYKVYSEGSSIVDSGTLTDLENFDLQINEVDVRATQVGDDIVSTTDATASAIAVAAAINASITGSDFTAVAEPNSVYLGTYTSGSIAAGELVINGQNIVPASNSADDLIIAINAVSETTGVTGSVDENNKVTLVADDGRNIQLVTDGTGAGTFEYFSTTGGALDKVQRGSVSLTHLDTAIEVSGTIPTDVGFTAGTTPATSSSLTDSDYQVSYNGTNYILTRLSDNNILTSSTTSTLQGDGMTITINSGSMDAGDTFLVRPTIGASEAFSLLIDRPEKLAMASPIRVGSGIENSGTGEIIRGKIIDTSGSPVSTDTKLGNAFSVEGELTPPIRIEFFNDLNGDPTIYKVFDISNGVPGEQIGPDQTFTPNPSEPIEVFPLSSVVDSTTPGPNPAYVYDPGYRVSLSGAPDAGDYFTVGFNDDAAGDDGNAQEMLAMQNEQLLSDGTVTYQGAYTELVSRIGAITQTTEVNFLAAESLRRESESRIQSVSGVNLDEEAANLIKYQQAYRAAAQVIAAASNLFDTMIDAVRR